MGGEFIFILLPLSIALVVFGSNKRVGMLVFFSTNMLFAALFFIGLIQPDVRGDNFMENQVFLTNHWQLFAVYAFVVVFVLLAGRGNK